MKSIAIIVSRLDIYYSIMHSYDPSGYQYSLPHLSFPIYSLLCTLFLFQSYYKLCSHFAVWPFISFTLQMRPNLPFFDLDLLLMNLRARFFFNTRRLYDLPSMF